MMRVFPVVGVVAAVVGAGCVVDVGKHKGSPGPTYVCTPAAAFVLTVTVDGVNAQSLAGNTAMARVLVGSSASCAAPTVIAAGGTFQIQTVVHTQYPQPPITLELVLNSANEASFGPGDHHYSFLMGTDGTFTPGDIATCSPEESWDLTLDYATAPQSAVSWPLGSGC